MMKLIKPRDRIAIAIIGMPRSGTTIVTSFLNSLDEALIVGEPYRMLRVKRPMNRNLPNIFNSRYGELLFYPDRDALLQIHAYAFKRSLKIFGFKETWTPDIDPIALVKLYGNWICATFVVIREPRRNYASMIENTPQGHVPVDVSEFNRAYTRLAESTSEPGFYSVPLASFMEDPVAAICKDTGWQISGKIELKQFVGSGDTSARSAKKIYKTDRRRPASGSLLGPSINAYQKILLQ
jgi:hypothetical protein